MIDWLRETLPDSELPRLRDTLIEWCEISSGSDNIHGLSRMSDRLEQEFAPLAPSSESLPLPPCRKYDERGEPYEHDLGRVLRFNQRPEAPLRVLLNGHYDTVYGAGHPFLNCELLEDGGILRGPGVADMKGGLLVMREALRLFECYSGKDNLGWEVVLNPEEEIGTPGAREILRESAKRNHFGLVFECSTPDGGLVHRRLGTGFFMAVAWGKSAHAGRDFDEGRNAIEALSALILEFRKIYREMEGVILNAARMHSLSALNAVPEHAVAQFNFRAASPEIIEELEARIDQTLKMIEDEHEVRIDWTGDFDRPPRVPDERVRKMEEALEGCLTDLDQPFHWRDTGGGTDGSLLLDYGLPNIDSLGVRGEFLHSDRECMHLDSLIERIHLTTLFLIRAAEGEIDPQSFSRP